jgi:PAS domain S-box-containing protein
MAAWQFDSRTRELIRSPELNALLGIKPDDSPTFDEIAARLLPGEKDRIAAAIDTALKRPDHFYRLDVRIQRFDGEVRWFLLRAEAIPDERGRLTVTMGVLVDLTERKQEEEENAYLASVVASTPFAVISSDHLGNITSWNEGAARMFGHLREEVLGASISVIVPEDRADVTWEFFRQTMAGNPSTKETFRKRKDGTVFPAKVTAAPVIAPDGKIIGISSIIEDLTEARANEERQRLLVRELHHRVRNTLAIVQGIANVTARSARDVTEFRDSFGRRVAALANTHSRLTEAGGQTVGISELIDQELHPFVSEDRVKVHGPDVRLNSETAPTLAMAFHELATNAVKHGALQTRTGTIDIEWMVDGNLLLIQWAEHGAGLPTPKAVSGKGFGSILLDSVLPAQFGHPTERSFESDGARVTLRIPLAAE